MLVTNAPAVYTKKVLKEIGLSRVIRKRYHIEQMRIHGRYRPKPSQSMLRMLLAKEKVHPSRSVLIEDNHANLRSARAVGMHGVYVRGYDKLALKARGKASPPCLSGLALRVESVTHLIRRRRFLR